VSEPPSRLRHRRRPQRRRRSWSSHWSAARAPRAPPRARWSGTRPPSHLWGRLAGIEMLSWSSGPTLGGAEAPRPRRRDPDARGVRTVFDRPERPQEQDRGW